MNKKDLGNATNEKIEDLNLIALRKYACPKINAQKDWYLKCMECQGLESCRVGKRAIDIIESETKPKTQIEKFDERMLKKIEQEKRNSRNAVYFDALHTKDPVGYFMEKGVYDKRSKCAAKLKEFLLRNGLPEEILRYKANPVGVTNASDKTKVVHERLVSILEGTSGIEESIYRVLKYEAENGNATGNSISTKFYNYALKHSDLDKKYDFRAIARQFAGVDNVKLTAGELLVKFYPFGFSKPATDGDIQEDEISLEDFLKENEVVTPEGSTMTTGEAKALLEKKLNEQDQTKKKGILADFADNPDRPAPHVKTMPFTQEEAKKLLEERSNPNAPKETRLTVVGQEKVIPTNAQLVLRQEFSRKKQELRKRIDYIREQINHLLKVQEELADQMEMLDKTAELFGMKAKDLSQQKQAT